MRQRTDPRQVQKAAASLNGMDKAENLVEARGILWMAFPIHQRLADMLQRLARLRHKFADQLVHTSFPEFHPGPWRING